MNHTNQNFSLRFTRRSSLSDGHYVRMNDRITPKRFVGGLLAAAYFVATYIFLSGWF